MTNNQNVRQLPNGKIEYRDHEGWWHTCDNWEDYYDRINADVD